MTANTARHAVHLTGLAQTVLNFPNPVNEVAARMVVTISVAFVISGQWWLLAILTYGFTAWVATGPTLSPMGLLTTRFLAPYSGLTPRLVPGPPKLLAQMIGLVFSVTGLTLYFAMGSAVPAKAALTVLAAFARWGLIPRSVCEECIAVQASAN